MEKELDLGNGGLKSIRFNLGQVVMTCGVDGEIQRNGEFAKFVAKSFIRHCNGDWGDLCDEDKAMNDSAVANSDDRIVSRYLFDDEPIYIITEWDRSYTTILFASEY